MTDSLKHAKAYPFALPADSYVLNQDGWEPLHPGEHETRNRHAVIASGSNASPSRLEAKFKNHRDLLNDPLYVTKAKLRDFDTVYSAHFAEYGSIPATLAHIKNIETDVFVTWMTDGQLQRMHETESLGVNYDYVRLEGIGLVIEDGSGYTQAHAYLSRRGCLACPDGNPIALAAVNATGRTWKAMSQEDVLDHARKLIAPDLITDDFIRSHIDNADLRQQREFRIGAHDVRFGRQ